MARTILFFSMLVFYSIYGFFLWFAAWIVHFFNPVKADYMIFHSIQWACRTGLKLMGIKTEVYGRENIPPEGEASVFVINHRSIFDIICTYPELHNRTGFVAKDSLKKIPVFSTWIRKLNGLFLNREDIKEGVKTIKAATENVKSGISMCIFPEGTRNKDLSTKTGLLPFHGGSLKIAERSGAPIIPVAIYNTGEVFEGNNKRIQPCTIKLTFGAPIIVSELSREEKKFLTKNVERIMQDMMNSYEADK